VLELTVNPDGLRAVAELQLCAEPFGAVAAAATARIDAAFTSGVRQILWRSEVGDVMSRRVAWACGFTFEGSLRSDWVTRGRISDAWVGTLLADDARLPKTRWLEPVRLTGPDVVVREQSTADERRYLETVHDEDTRQWLSMIALPTTAESFRAMLARQHYGPSIGASLPWTVAEPATDRYLGSITLFGMGGLDHLSAEVGYRIHPDARGRGLMKVALRRVVAYAFLPTHQQGLGLERVSLGAADGNLGSQRVARACGFTETGRDRRCYELHDTTVVDLVRFDLLRSDYVAG
jgi:RimJ/RimL family protein N-acetyltransferase